MFVTGVGIGPTFSVFTIIVQNAVPFSELGVATSNLTFFRQIGGSIGLAFVGTIFAHVLPGAARAADGRGGRPARRRWAQFFAAIQLGKIDFNSSPASVASARSLRRSSRPRHQRSMPS